MTVETSTNRVQYATNGTTGPFTVPYKFLANADLDVYHTDSAGEPTLLTLVTHYSVTGALNPSGGTITTVTAYPSGGSLSIVRSVDALQPIDFEDGSALPADALETGLDRLTMIAQQQNDVGTHSLRIASAETSLSELPNASARANRMAAFDTTGDASVTAFTQAQVAAAIAAAAYSGIPGGYITSTATVAASAGATLINITGLTYTPGTKSLIVFADGLMWEQGAHYIETSSTSITLIEALATDTTFVFVVGRLVTSGVESGEISWTKTATGAAARTLTAKLDELPSLDDFSGGTDHAKLTAAVAHANLTGQDLFIPPRIININTDLGSITLEEVTLRGVGVGDGDTATIDAGSTFSVTGTTNSPFKIRRGTAIIGCNFYYPNIANSAAPTVHPVTLDFDFTAGAVQHVVLRGNVVVNAYDWLRINDAGGAVGHVWIEDNTVCALRYSIQLRRNQEVVKIEGNTFSFGHWLAATEGNARAFYRANAVHLKYDEGDGVFFNNNLCFGSLKGLLLCANGTVQLAEIIGNKFDQTRYGIHADGAGNWTQSLFVGNHFYCVNAQDTTLQANAIRITTTGAVAEVITIGPNSFVLATEDMIYVTGDNPARRLVVGPSNWGLWAAYKAAGTYGALNVNGTITNLTVSGGWMDGQAYTAYASGIIGSFNTLTCNGVTFNGCKQPLNVTVNSATGAGNVSYVTNGATSDQITATTLCWGPNRFDKPHFKTPLVVPLGDMATYANDAAAAAAGVPIGGFYRNASAMNIRIA